MVKSRSVEEKPLDKIIFKKIQVKLSEQFKSQQIISQVITRNRRREMELERNHKDIEQDKTGDIEPLMPKQLPPSPRPLPPPGSLQIFASDHFISKIKSLKSKIK